MGARVVGIDINPKCEEVLNRNRPLFPDIRVNIPIITGSILEAATLQRAQEASPDGGTYDVVHSWGVLHHTGNMKAAVCNAARLVKPGGYFVVALYNRHWSSRAWLMIKYTYCKVPLAVQRLMVKALMPVIYIAKWIVTRENPRKQSRGMDFFTT
jgi:2-polyprenyl-6-hydroxyphenyl methylase/3-demethylubiquinone-9 3-methyltransferase